MSRRKERKPVQQTTVRFHLHAYSVKTCSIFVTSQICRHLKTYSILHPNQHGFRKGLSCDETQLISTLQDWTLSADHKRQTDVVLLGFSKAFDNVSHRRLLRKVDLIWDKRQDQSMDCCLPGTPHQSLMYCPECIRGLCLVTSYSCFTVTTSPLPSVPPCACLQTKVSSSCTVRSNPQPITSHCRMTSTSYTAGPSDGR